MNLSLEPKKRLSVSLFSGLLLVSIFNLQLLAGSLVPASAPSLTNFAGAGGSFLPVLSADGRYVAFVSQANNLVAEATSSLYLDVFVRDLLTGTTTLVSVNAAGSGGGRGNSSHPSISADGRWIAFESAAPDLVTNDNNQLPDIFARDLVTGATRLVSANSNNTASGSDIYSAASFKGSFKPVITPDGRWVTFESTLIDLMTNGANEFQDVYARDVQSGTTVRVSVGARKPYPPRRVASHSAAPTPDARRVAFVSTAANLLPGLTNLLGEIYVRDLPANVTYWASTNLTNFPAFAKVYGYECIKPAINADGRFVAFKAAVAYLPNQVWVFRHDLETGQSLVIASNSSHSTWPAISADGSRVACEMLNQLYVWDAQTGTNLLVSVNAAGTGPGNGISHTPVLTPDGKTLAFLSSATDLVSEPAVAPGSGFQLYVRDLATGTTRLASAGVSGRAGTATLEGILPALSADGRRVAFDSPDDTLVPGDLNQASDVFVRDMVVNTTELVSRRSATMPARTGAGQVRLEPPLLSADGRVVAFTTSKSDLDPGKTNRVQDLMVRDWIAGTMLAPDLDEPVSGGASALHLQLALSANGQSILFSKSRMDVGNVTPTNHQVFWHDLALGVTEEIDPAILFQPNSEQYRLARTRIFKPALSGDGRWVAYSASRSDVNPPTQLFLRDMVAHTNILLSAKGGCGNCAREGGNNFSVNPVFSPDNRRVVFQSSAGNLISNKTYSSTYYVQLYARDLISNATCVVSVNATGGPMFLGVSAAPAFSASSRYLAFHQFDVSDGPFYSDQRFNYRSFLYDFQTLVTTQVCVNCLNPTPSADGRWVAFERIGASNVKDIYLKDMQTSQEQIISTNRASLGAASANSSTPLISADGRFVVFASSATNLVANDTNNCTDIFVYDRIADTVLLVSGNRQGTGAGNGASSYPVMSTDGRTVAFHSFADDLVEGDYNQTGDIFVLRLVADDSDTDGLPDDWEVACFDSLSRDGSGDYDGDGLTDRQEYLAGTDPDNQGSILQVLALTSAGGGPVMLFWSAVPGKTYHLQYKDSVDEPWTPFPDAITATSATASAQDDSAANTPQRFYRVKLVVP